MIHAVTPFSRPGFIPAYATMLGVGNMHWHVLCHDESHLSLFPKSDLITTYLVDAVTLAERQERGLDWCYTKLNWFLRTAPLVDEDYYGFLADDTGYPPEFFDNLRQRGGDVVVYKAYRGEVTVAHGRDTGELPALYDWMRAGSIDMCQMFVRGKILRGRQFQVHCMGDGVFAERLRAEVPLIDFSNDLCIWHNLFEPRRYQKPSTRVGAEVAEVIRQNNLCPWEEL